MSYTKKPENFLVIQVFKFPRGRRYSFNQSEERKFRSRDSIRPIRRQYKMKLTNHLAFLLDGKKFGRVKRLIQNLYIECERRFCCFLKTNAKMSSLLNTKIMSTIILKH